MFEMFTSIADKLSGATDKIGEMFGSKMKELESKVKLEFLRANKEKFQEMDKNISGNPIYTFFTQIGDMLDGKDPSAKKEGFIASQIKEQSKEFIKDIEDNPGADVVLLDLEQKHPGFLIELFVKEGATLTLAEQKNLPRNQDFHFDIGEYGENLKGLIIKSVPLSQLLPDSTVKALKVTYTEGDKQVEKQLTREVKDNKVEYIDKDKKPFQMMDSFSFKVLDQATDEKEIDLMSVEDKKDAEQRVVDLSPYSADQAGFTVDTPTGSIDTTVEKNLNTFLTNSPLGGKITVNSPFGMRFHPLYKRNIMHTGIDLQAAIGDPIFAAAPGKISYSGFMKGYGNVIMISHSNGAQTLYAHCSRLETTVGQVVAGGTEVARAGMTGGVTGPHLHFEIITPGGKKFDPATAVHNCSNPSHHHA